MKGQRMTKIKLEDLAFSKLVQAIDEKWSHTYIDVPDQPELTDEMRDELDEIARAECDFDPQY
jgi:predicted outer membrane protein